MRRLNLRGKGLAACMLMALSLPVFGGGLDEGAESCMKTAAEKYSLSYDLLWAIAKQESGFNPRAVNVNTNGSMDIGAFQINTAWLPTLAKFGITRASLFDFCTSAHVGAWVLAQNIRTYGNTWNAVGAYNAKSPAKRMVYIKKISRHLASKE